MKIAIIQSGIEWENPESNLLKTGNLIKRSLPAEGCDLIILPEMFTTGFTMRSADLSEKMDGKTVNWMISVAQEYNSAVAGSIIIGEDNRFFNRLLFVRPDTTVSWYDKVHLFSLGGENENYSRGDRHLTENFRGFNIEFQICYDLRFPVWSRNVNNRYDILINVANWPEARKMVWKTLLAARAIENQCWVAGVNRIGVDGSGNFYSGDSMIINPRGEVVASIEPYREGVGEYDLPVSELVEFREKFPVWKDSDGFELKSIL